MYAFLMKLAQPDQHHKILENFFDQTDRTENEKHRKNQPTNRSTLYHIMVREKLK